MAAHAQEASAWTRQQRGILRSAALVVALALCAAALLVPGLVHAADPPRVSLRLDYIRGGSTCPDANYVGDMLRGEMGYDPRRPDADLHLVVEATRRGSKHRVSFALRDATNAALWAHEYEDPDCIEVLRSAMLTTALELEPALNPSPPVPPTAAPPTSTPPLTPAAPPSLAAPPATPPAPELPVDVLLGADALAAVGTTPSPSLGVSIFAGVWLRRLPLSFELSGRANWTPMTVELGGVRFRSTFYAGILATCGRWRLLYGCSLLGIGETDHQATGPVATNDEPRPFAVIGARIGAKYPVAEHLTLRGFMDVLGLPGSTALVFHGAQQWRASAGGAVGAGVSWQP